MSPINNELLSYKNSAVTKKRSPRLLEREGFEKKQKMQEIDSNAIHIMDHTSIINHTRGYPYGIWKLVFAYLKPADLYRVREEDVEEGDIAPCKKSGLIAASKTFKLYLTILKNDVCYWKDQCDGSFKDTMLSLSLERKSQITSWYDFYQQENSKEKKLISHLLVRKSLGTSLLEIENETNELIAFRSFGGLLFYLTDVKLIIKNIEKKLNLTITFSETDEYYAYEDLFLLEDKIYLKFFLVHENNERDDFLFEYQNEDIHKKLLETDFDLSYKTHALPVCLSIKKQTNFLVCDLSEDQLDYVYLFNLETAESFQYLYSEYLCFVAERQGQIILWDFRCRSFVEIDKSQINEYASKAQSEEFEIEEFSYEIHDNLLITKIHKSFLLEVSENSDGTYCGTKTPTISELGDGYYEKNMFYDEHDHLQHVPESPKILVENLLGTGTPTEECLYTSECKCCIEIYDLTNLKKIHEFSLSVEIDSIKTITYNDKLYCFEGNKLIYIFDLFLGNQVAFESNYDEIMEEVMGAPENFKIINGLCFFSQGSKSFFIDLINTQYHLVVKGCRFNVHSLDQNFMVRMENNVLITDNCQSKDIKSIDLLEDLVLSVNEDEMLGDTPPFND